MNLKENVTSTGLWSLITVKTNLAEMSINVLIIYLQIKTFIQLSDNKLTVHSQ